MKNRCGETGYVSKGVNRNYLCVLYIIYWNCVHFGTRGFHVTVLNFCLCLTHLISDLGKKKQCKISAHQAADNLYVPLKSQQGKP